MTTIVTYGDRMITASGRESWLKRGSVPFAQYGMGTVAISGDGRVMSFQSLYESQPWLAVTVNKINRQIVRLPLRAYRHLDEEGESEPLPPDHPLSVLLRSPWPRASSASLKQRMTRPALVHGNSLLWKVREGAGAAPNMLRPLDWRYVTPLLFGNEMVGWQTTEFGDQITIAPEDIVHFAWDDGSNGLGVSPLSQLGVTVRSEDSAQRYQASSFDNGARPSGALVLPAESSLDADERAELREEIQAQHGGVDQSFKMALLSGGMQWTPFSHTAVEAELIEQRRLNREEIAAVYDVDPPMIGILDHATYSNVEQMHKMLYGPTLGPWLTLEAETLGAQLVDMEPAWEDERCFVAFDLTEVLKANTQEEITAIQTAIGTGVMTPNEGRGRLKLRRSDNPAADELYMPTNNMEPMGTEPPEPAPVPPALYAPPADAEDDDATEDGPAKQLTRVVSLAGSRAAKGQPLFDRARFVREATSAGCADVDWLADRVAEAAAQSATPTEFAAAVAQIDTQETSHAA